MIVDENVFGPDEELEKDAEMLEKLGENLEYLVAVVTDVGWRGK